jgi:hypothetical protein
MLSAAEEWAGPWPGFEGTAAHNSIFDIPSSNNVESMIREIRLNLQPPGKEAFTE